MQRTTTWILPLALALAVTLAQSLSLACDICGMPEAASCIHHDILDSFEAGGGDDHASYVVGGSGQGWTTTSGGTSPFGEEAILTWSIVPDGTAMPQGQGEAATPSNLIAFLDGIHHGGPGPGGADLTQRAWFPLIKSAFDRWDAVSAIRFSYESHDDGVSLGGLGGITGVRGDHRIGGHNIDGEVRPSVVAYNYFPNNADLVLDTSETVIMGNPGGGFLRIRNTFMHEIGHGLGLNHPASSDSNYLMEALLDVTIDGPQFDDILGIHRLYGDRFEEFGGNDNIVNPTNLGSLLVGHSIKLGEDAVDRVVASTDIDFLSINMNTDTDFFKFSVSHAGELDIVLTPVGPTYQAGPHGGTQTTFVSSAQNNLSLFLYDGTGLNLLGSSTAGGLGAAESLLDFAVAGGGDYFIRIAGAQNTAQFYQLDIALVPEPAGLTLLVLGIIAFCGPRRR